MNTKKKFHVVVSRTSYASRTIDIWAKNKAEAKRLALDDAGNHLYNEHDADYSVDAIEEMCGWITTLCDKCRRKRKNS
jgi:hypothetical protein